VLQQWLAAVLNRYAFGTDDGGVIDAAKAAYCSATNKSDLQPYIGLLGDYNSSGETVPLPFESPSATPQLSRLQANIVTWDKPTVPYQQT
jgi:hypothetical protein